MSLSKTELMIHFLNHKAKNTPNPHVSKPCTFGYYLNNPIDKNISTNTSTVANQELTVETYLSSRTRSISK
ncbi:hypothetical protein VCHA54O482_30180 [Vibrio chagasii]|nr:hypothetical protein VCHA49P382_40059 [Vibrio chagasii]CAH7429463.1 hypothetical protein VCHA54O482_30180 [Vibrio chagasii]